MSHAAIDAAVDYIQSHHADLWDRKGGKDFIWIITQDHGYCGFATAESMSSGIRQSIILTHWGLTDNEVPCNDFLTYGCWTRQAHVWEEQHLPCFVPGKDTVIPSTAAGIDNLLTPLHSQARLPARVIRDRDIRLYFAGGIHLDDASYSHGVRQTLLLLFNNTPGTRCFKLVNTETGMNSNYMADFGRSVFCFAATGAGWGVRLKLALMHGCIPVIVADHVEMPFEDVLPYPEFAVRLREHALFRLPALLDDISAIDGLVERMQRNVDCVWKYFTWRDPEARALDALMCSLARKLTSGRITPVMDWEACALTCDA